MKYTSEKVLLFSYLVLFTLSNQIMYVSPLYRQVYKLPRTTSVIIQVSSFVELVNAMTRIHKHNYSPSSPLQYTNQASIRIKELAQALAQR